MEVNRIFFHGKSGRLPQTAAMEGCLQNLKINFRLPVFNLDLQPGPALLASGQISAVLRNLGIRHILTFPVQPGAWQTIPLYPSGSA